MENLVKQSKEILNKSGIVPSSDKVHDSSSREISSLKNHEQLEDLS